MQITRSTPKDGTLCPKAVNYLENLPPAFLFNRQHQLRHPLSIYCLSLDNIADAYNKVAEQYVQRTADARGQNPAPDFTPLLAGQKNFLLSLQEHIDHCYLVLKTLVDPATVRYPESFSDQFVIKNNLPGAKSFFDAIATYKRTLQIANKLKHQQCQLRPVMMFPNNAVHLGYYLEEPDTNGNLGPSPEIHPDQGAFSFARDLSLHLFKVYVLSEKLVKAVNSAVQSLHGFTLPSTKPPLNQVPVEKWNKLLSSISAIPDAIFPKEAPRGIARFLLDDQRQVLKIKFPVHISPRFPASIRTSVVTVLDAYNLTRKVAFP